jgi:hypothetical protein
MLVSSTTAIPCGDQVIHDIIDCVEHIFMGVTLALALVLQRLKDSPSGRQQGIVRRRMHETIPHAADLAIQNEALSYRSERLAISLGHVRHSKEYPRVPAGGQENKGKISCIDRIQLIRLQLLSIGSTRI